MYRITKRSGKRPWKVHLKHSKMSFQYRQDAVEFARFIAREVRRMK